MAAHGGVPSAKTETSDVERAGLLPARPQQLPGVRRPDPAAGHRFVAGTLADRAGSWSRAALRLHLGGRMSAATNAFLGGLVTMCFIVIGVFFLKFWTRTRDFLFIAFGIAFWLM